jgi:hypothetical protein
VAPLPIKPMRSAITNYLQLHPIDSSVYEDKREPVESRIFRILTRSKFRSASLAKSTTEFIHQHIQTQVNANQPIQLIYAMGGGRGINTHNFPKADWGEYLHLKFLVENIHPIGSIYRPGVEIKWSLDDYAARILNNYKQEWQEEYIRGFDTLLEYFNHQSRDAITQVRLPTTTWYKSFDELKERLTTNATAKVGTNEAQDIIAKWGKRAANNFYNKENLTGDALQKAIAFSAFLNIAWLDYDFEVRGEYFGSGIPIAHFTDFPDSLYIQTVPGSNVQFWKASGYIEHKDGIYKSRLATREVWKQLEAKLKFTDNPLADTLPGLGSLPILDAK